jgi:RNA polymerase sigma factor (sigma-70 family)
LFEPGTSVYEISCKRRVNLSGTIIALYQNMDKDILSIMQKFELVSRSLANRWGKPYMWQDIYSDMCCAFVKKNHKFTDKPISYVIKACKNEAINIYLSGKSVCSKPRNSVEMVSIECLSENLSTNIRFEKQVQLRILIERIFKILTEREKQVASLIMEGHTEKEIAELLSLSQQRINRIKKRIRKKFSETIHKKVVI